MAHEYSNDIPVAAKIAITGVWPLVNGFSSIAALTRKAAR